MTCDETEGKRALEISSRPYDCLHRSKHITMAERSRTLLHTIRTSIRSQQCTHSQAYQPSKALHRTFTTTLRLPENPENSDESLPRWRQTPKRMTMPFRVRPLSKRPPYVINDKPQVLHDVYDSVFGRQNGYATFPEELRWLAVTHKSFDHGRQGSNDRLAFLGEQNPSLVRLVCS